MKLSSRARANCLHSGGILRPIVIFALLLCVSGVANAEDSPGWIADQQSGCRVWNNYSDPDDRIKWGGRCVDGYAEGTGTLTWFTKGQLYGTDKGQFKKGKLEGHAIRQFPRGRFEGEFRDNKPNGTGTFRDKDGNVYAGMWNNGCFQQGNRRTTVSTSAKECGF